MTKIFISIAILLSCISPCSGKSDAQDDNKNVDWNQIELDFYDLVKYQHPDVSEAQIEFVTGYGLLTSYNQWERASVHLKKAVRLDPKLYKAWYLLGLIYCDSEDGYNYLKKSTEAKPDFAEPYYWMAYYRCRCRQDKDAILLFKKYLEVAKRNKEDANEEAARIEVAENVLQDLSSGKEGKDLSIIRRTYLDEKSLMSKLAFILRR